MPALPVPAPGTAADSAKSSTRAHNISHGSRSANGRPDSHHRMSPVRSVLPPLPSRSPTNRFTSPRFHASTTSTASSSRSIFRPPNLRTPQTPTRYRRSSSFRYNFDLSAPNESCQDSTFEDVSLIDTALVDDPFISLIAGTEWSSPSIYPPLTNTSSGTNTSQGTRTSGIQPCPSNSQPTNYPEGSSFSSDNRFTSRLVSQSSTSLSASISVPTDDDLFDELSDSLFPATARSTIAEVMPAVTRSRASEPQASTPSKRQRKSGWFASPETKNQPGLDSDEDPFASDPFEGKMEVKQDGTLVDDDATESLKAIDLTETNDVPEEASQREVDNRVKLGGFQCAICMDNVTSLVVTHCGHLYCAACLHQSLHVASTRGKCPMCRAKVETKPRSSYTSKTKGYWPLELKLMTSVRKGKRKADAINND